MPNFRYVAIEPNGRLTSGQVTVADPAGAALLLEQRQLRVVRIEPARGSRLLALLNTEISLGAPASAKEIAFFLVELGTLLEAGLPLDAALQSLRDSAARKRFAAIVGQLHERVREGASLSAAMRAAAGIFDENIRASVEAAERTGELAKTLRATGEQLERAARLRATIVSSLYYPAILLVTAIAAIVFVFSVVLPQFEPIFAAAGRDLPPITRLIRGIGAIVTGYYWVAPLFAAAAAGAYAYSRRDARARQRWDRLLLRLPIVGSLFTQAEMARLSRLLGSQLAAGVPIESALALGERAMRNRFLAATFSKVREHVRNGERLGQVLKREPAFPPLIGQLASIGEESGRLDLLLLRAAELFEGNLRVALDRTVALITPVVTIVLGLVVAMIIFAVLSAIMAVNQLV